MNEWFILFYDWSRVNQLTTIFLQTISCKIHEITHNTGDTRNIKDKKHNKTKYALNYSSQVCHISIIFHYNPEIFLPLGVSLKLNRDLHKSSSSLSPLLRNTSHISRGLIQRHSTLVTYWILNHLRFVLIKNLFFKGDLAAMATSRTQNSKRRHQEEGVGKEGEHSYLWPIKRN